MARVRMAFTDYGNERSRATFPVADAILDATITALVSAIEGLTLGTRGTAYLVVEEAKNAGADTPATSPYAQRENKYLCRYQDDVTAKFYQLEIPTADLNELATNSDLVDLEGVAGAAFKTAFEDAVQTDDGNAVTLISVQFVGRNL